MKSNACTCMTLLRDTLIKEIYVLFICIWRFWTAHHPQRGTLGHAGNRKITFKWVFLLPVFSSPPSHHYFCPWRTKYLVILKEFHILSLQPGSDSPLHLFKSNHSFSFGKKSGLIFIFIASQQSWQILALEAFNSAFSKRGTYIAEMFQYWGTSITWPLYSCSLLSLK